MSTTFRALAVRNYRLYFTGQLLSSTGTWMQRVAQDWLVLGLSGGSGVALGITTGLQFLPYLLFSLWGGAIADRLPRRRILITTQALMALLALVLGVITLSGNATVGLVYCFAFTLGVVSAIDNPSRQAFVGDMVTTPDLPNAVALNTTAFNLSRIVGPALAGILIALIGIGWVFIINGLSFGVAILALLVMRASELILRPRQEGTVRLRQGLTYVRQRHDLLLVLALAFTVGTLGLNFQLTMALMAQKQFGLGAAAFGVMSTAMAIGSTAGSLMSARRTRVSLLWVTGGALGFGAMEAVVGLSPTYWSMLLVLPFVGILAMVFINSAQSYMQLRTDSWVRGRVMGVYTFVFFGGTPVGAPLIGWAAEHFGPRSGLLVGGIGTFVVTAIAAVIYLRKRDAGSPSAPVPATAAFIS